MSNTPRNVRDVVELARLRELLTSGEARRIRESNNLPQSVFADACSTTRGAISRYERGTRRPSSSVARTYLAILDALRERS